MRLIDADKLFPYGAVPFYQDDGFKTADRIYGIINDAPTVDAVPLEVWKQTAWERDIAIEQLEEHGIPFGGIAPDVVKVVRCKDCKHYDLYRLLCKNGNMNGWINFDGYCSYGERETT